MERQKCTKCRKWKPLDFFSFRTAAPHKKQRQSQCRECDNIRNKQYYADNKDMVAEKLKKRYEASDYMYIDQIKRRAKKWGYTEEEIANYLKEHDSHCHICGIDVSESTGRFKRPMVDHNHSTNKIRGLLCHRCNLMLGLAKDDHELLAKASEYVRTRG